MGGFGQYMAELTSAVEHGMDICHVLLRNDELGKISKEQRTGHYAAWETDLVNPDFAAYARSCGAVGLRIEHAAGWRRRCGRRWRRRVPRSWRS